MELMEEKKEFLDDEVDDKIENIKQTENEEISFGLFQWLLLLASGIVNGSDAVETVCMSYILPLIECDLNFQPKEKAYALMCYFIGMMIGGLAWGVLSDIYGRKRMLISSLLLNSICALLSAFPNTYFIFCIIRFFAGIGIGGNVPIIWGYFAEFLPTKHRAKMLCGLACFWFVGAFYASTIARLILSHSVQLTFMAKWRFFMLICSLPSFLTIFVFIGLPESGMFVSKLYSDDAYKNKLILHIKKFNETRSFKRKFVVYRQMMKLEHNENSVKPISHQQFNFRSIINPIHQLFSETYRRNCILILIILLNISFAFYGLWMWLPHLFRRMELNGGHICAPLYNSSIHHLTEHQIRCRIDEQEITDTIFSYFGGIPGNILILFLVDRFDRRKLLILSFILLSTSTTLFPFVYAPIQGVIIMVIFSSTAAVIYNIMSTVQTELFPTEIRTSAIGFFTISIRISSIFSNCNMYYCNICILSTTRHQK
ncbi:hypothetical protein SNEBB_005974 [Seison nebaliae]|nr:hypothetical protein SNEBB_005974 [Seison nebaliae]